LATLRSSLERKEMLGDSLDVADFYRRTVVILFTQDGEK
jgi:hypothetical protein